MNSSQIESTAEMLGMSSFFYKVDERVHSIDTIIYLHAEYGIRLEIH